MRTLTLKKENLAELTADELTAVVGAGTLQYCLSKDGRLCLTGGGGGSEIDACPTPTRPCVTP